MTRKTRTFYTFLLVAAFAMAAGAVACIDTTPDLDKSDETEGAT